jgi:hypothetical protein
MDVAVVNQIRSFRTTARSTVLRDLATELAPLIDDISEWRYSTGTTESGSAMADVNHPGKFIVTTQRGNVAKTMHELTHIRCFNAYGADFVAYHVDPTVLAGLPSYGTAAYGSGAYLGILADRQMKLANLTMDGPTCTQNGTIRRQIAGLAQASGLSKTRKKEIADKLSYADMWPHVEHDTCINQILVWLHNWGYPETPAWWKKSTKASTKALLTAVETEVVRLRQARAAG